MLDQFLLGLSVVLQPHILMYAFFGVFIGQLIGVLPGRRGHHGDFAVAAGDILP